MNNLAVFDIDNTIIKGHSQKIFAKYLFRKKLIKKFPFCIILLWFILYKLRIIKDINFITKKSYNIFNGYKIKEVNSLIKDCFNSDLKSKVYRQAAEEIIKNKKSGFKIIFISNTLQGLVDEFVNFFNADDGIGTRLVISGDKITGEVDGDLIYGDKKVDALVELINKKYNNNGIIRCYADHYSDLELLNFCTQPIATNPDKLLADYAKNKSWKILNFNL